MFNIGIILLRQQDLLCLALYYFGFSRVRNYFYHWRKIPIARILAFHDVHYSEARGFREKLEAVQKVANVISLDDIFAGRMSRNRLNIAITFDDCFRGWYDNVCPVLKDLGMSATFFVSSGLVGLKDKMERNFLRNNLRSNRQTTGQLTSEELRNIASEGFTIGGHTRNHVNLAEISDINKLREEIRGDKNLLEKITGKKVEYFAYPCGIWRNESIDLAQILKECGYRGAVTLVSGLITANMKSYYLHRELVNASMPMSVFKARVLGNYDGVMFARRILKL